MVCGEVGWEIGEWGTKRDLCVDFVIEAFDMI